MKLLASDLDGTLVHRNASGKMYIKEEDKRAIHAFRQAGHLFGACTGRGLSMVRYGCEEIPFDFFVVNSGAGIYDRDQNVMLHETIEKSLVEKIVSLCQGAEFLFIDQGHPYMMHPLEDPFCDVIENMDSLGDALDGFSLVIPGDIDTTSSFFKKIVDSYGHDLSSYQNKDAIDFVAKGCSKGTGVAFVAQKMHIARKDIHVIGDSWNDLPMLEAFEKTFTFTYAPASVQATAKYQVSSLSQCIEEIMKEA